MKTVYEFMAPAGTTLKEFMEEKIYALKNLPGDISKSKIRRLIVSGAVRVNKTIEKRPQFKFFKKSQVSFELDTVKFFFEKQPDDIDFTLTEENVLYEDEFIIVVNKPSKFPTEQTITKNRKNMHDAVVDYLWRKNPELKNPPYAGIMHRLDRDTSGALLFTKKRNANKNIFEQFENHTIQKKYLAASTFDNFSNSYAKPPKLKEEHKFIVSNYLGRISKSSHGAKYGSVRKEDGDFAETHFNFLKNVNISDINLYLFEAMPVTGRTHQIRSHLAESSLPILGDQIYGGRKFERLMLHAHSLEFFHPINTDEKIIVTAPCPDFDSILSPAPDTRQTQEKDFERT